MLRRCPECSVDIELKTPNSLRNHRRKKHGTPCPGCGKKKLNVSAHQQATGCGAGVAERFNRLIQSTALSADRAATEAHQQVAQAVRERAQSLWFVAEVFNSGSYARGTAICPLNDIDMFVVLCPECPYDVPEAMKQLKRVLRASQHGFGTIRLQNSSVGITTIVDGQIVSVDLVPAVKDKDRYRILDRRSGREIFTNPKEAKAALKRAEEACPNIKTYIRLLKRWNSQFEHKLFASYHLEVMCYDFNAPVGNSRRAFAALLRHVADRALGCVHTPGVSGHFIDEGVREKDKRQMREWLTEDAETAEKAYLAEVSGDGTAACRLWQEVFGSAWQ